MTKDQLIAWFGKEGAFPPGSDLVFKAHAPARELLGRTCKVDTGKSYFGLLGVQRPATMADSIARQIEGESMPGQFDDQS